jgi:hypothetical protein
MGFVEGETHQFPACGSIAEGVPLALNPSYENPLDIEYSTL